MNIEQSDLATILGNVSYSSGGEKRITTRKGTGHGQGLKNIERAIEKYDGLMDIAHDEHTFTARVFLYEKKSLKP
ncbi:MAG: GHKL domain-containing protein [Treponema sp.]|nr:GHKL domain-containing protein [Treponema sp.]